LLERKAIAVAVIGYQHPKVKQAQQVI